MKKTMIAAITAIVVSCKKTNVAPAAECKCPPPQTVFVFPVDSAWRLHSILNYSTVTTTPSAQELEAQANDTTYYQILKDGKVRMQFAMNWTYTQTPAFDRILNLQQYFPNLRPGDTIEYKVVHRTPRPVNTYDFSASVFWQQGQGWEILEQQSLFNGQRTCFPVSSGHPNYVPGRQTFAHDFRVVIDNRINIDYGADGRMP